MNIWSYVFQQMRNRHSVMPPNSLVLPLLPGREGGYGN